MGKYNDLDLSQWREYTDIETDSLWIIDKRDNSGAHSGHYHGNFVPQIPHQLFSRYTKKGDWILVPIYGKWNIINRSTTHGEKFNRNRNST
ncbi:DNA adenine modification methylase [human gut metagenome]|uniref:DNA adenine modification methylase n=1 Tax=human gut metagenome TaxID=408170 RepID=K1UC44_9ZZZZ